MGSRALSIKAGRISFRLAHTLSIVMFPFLLPDILRRIVRVLDGKSVVNLLASASCIRNAIGQADLVCSFANCHRLDDDYEQVLDRLPVGYLILFVNEMVSNQTTKLRHCLHVDEDDENDIWLDEVFLWACGSGHLDLCQFLVQKYKINPRVQRDFGVTLASNGGHTAIVEFLLALGANPNADSGEALVRASKLGHLETVQILTVNGTRPARTRHINRAVVVASAEGRLPVVKYLMNHKNQRETMSQMSVDQAFIYACEGGHIDTVGYLHALGADLHAQDDLSLSHACGNGHLDVAKFLVNNGANIRARRNGAAREAFQYGRVDVARYLRLNLAESYPGVGHLNS